MAYSEIINEIQEQIDGINASIVQQQTDAEEAQSAVITAQENITRFQAQLEGLNTLKTNAQALIDGQNSIDINLNVNVATDANSQASVIRHTNPTSV